MVTDGKFFRLGGQQFYVRGVTYGPFPPNSYGEPFPSPEPAVRDFAQLRDLGANARAVLPAAYINRNRSPAKSRASNLVSGITREIQFGGLFTDRQIQWPNMYPGKYPHELGRPDINRNPAQLCQLGNLPQHDCRYAPWFRGKQFPFGGRRPVLD